MMLVNWVLKQFVCVHCIHQFYIFSGQTILLQLYNNRQLTDNIWPGLRNWLYKELGRCKKGKWWNGVEDVDAWVYLWVESLGLANFQRSRHMGPRPHCRLKDKSLNKWHTLLTLISSPIASVLACVCFKGPEISYL